MNIREVLRMRRVGSLVVMVFVIAVLGLSCGDVVAPYSSQVTVWGDVASWYVACNNGVPAFASYYRHFVTAVVTYSNKTAPVSQVDQPMNGVELTWWAPAGDLWLRDDDFEPYYNKGCNLCTGPDDPNCPECKDVLWPLEKPYDTETDERGLSEIIWILTPCGQCGGSLPYSIFADVGVARGSYQVTFEVEAEEEQETE